MVVEKQRGTLDGEDGDMDWCPVGLRVLAVDDDPVSLKLLNQLLLSCQYQVTTTNQAIEALEILRQERNKFDLVISDVNMPEMDGFKLLELLRIEMDLPVIMLSGHDDTKLVMKGICYGACAYLLKPIRIEELKTIWQHVVRRKIFDSKDQNNSLHKVKSCLVIGEGGQGLSPTDSSGQNDKLHKKRKYPNEDEEEGEGSDDKHENEGPSSHKKPRVVWSEELREKFIAALIQLGPKDAVPKKILEVMNVEGLSRENVASHLQKYRNNLKRNSCVATQQASLGGKDNSNMHIGLHNGFGDLYPLAGSGRLSNAALSSYTPGGLLGRLNSPTGFSIQGITSSGLDQPVFRPAVPANQCPNSFQTIPTSLELNQLKQSKCTTYIAEPNPNNDPKSYTVLSRFQDTRVSGSSIQSDSHASSNPLMLQENPQLTDITGVFGNPSSLRVALLNQEEFDLGICGSSEILNHNLCGERLEGAIQLSRFPSDALPMSELFNHGQLHANNLGVSSSWPQIGNNPNDFPSISVLSAPVEELRGDIQNEEGLVGNAFTTMNYTPNQSWEEHKQDYNHNLSLTFSAINSLISANGIVDPLSQSLDQNNAVCYKKMNSCLYNQLNGVATIFEQPSEIEKSAIETNMQSSEDYLLEQIKLHDGFIQNSCESLNDIMSVRLKRGQNGNMLPDGEFGFDDH